MCEAVAFEVSKPLLGALYCHCKRCQRRTGSAYAVTALTEPGSFAITRGAELVKTYRPPDDGWLKSFCSACGSHLHTTNPENDQLIALRVGALDGDPGLRPSVHQFVDYAPEWSPVPDDGLPRFPERMTWE
ncbi:MAG TPA: GFA family protein [Solirubrobacterales bacterium]|nr:GFA family protein [Solirubrobacterales bacterium]